MLWIALHLPLLSLEAFATTLPGEQAQAPLALVDGHHIAAANAAAGTLGVEPGQKRATALALAPDLLIGQADASRDASALTAVAHAALAFTPSVCLQPSHDPQRSADTVLLEVRSSLRYFGGPARLLQRLREAVTPLGHRIQAASALTPLGAALLARGPRRVHCQEPPAMQRALDALPVWLLGPGREHWEALQGMGLSTLADLRRLPRSGLARRFGPALLADLDRAYGERPDPRVAIALPPHFESRLELFARADSAEQVLHAAGMLLARLASWLAAQHAFVRGFALAMQHEPRWRSDAQVPPQTVLEVVLAEPSRDPAHLQVLLRERLAQLQLPAPTLELRLSAREIVPGEAPSGELFPSAASEREGLVRLVERLQARLGAGHVQRLQAVHDHRPERASAVRPAEPARIGQRGAVVSVPATPLRPVWLLAPPEPLAVRDDRPLRAGRVLRLLSGPERIEAGWWDHELAERDYFIAEDAEGALVWLYRARLPGGEGGGWFLHGRFA
ncbi:DNA polymerase Y family protein [uncultured Piscinibacter sp.]|uniref:Y-family DNA polymerase n=1 Tax=uncultured Piscinibacter sp. TaxID=1131835 RepID=UPI0026170C3C|nr:DNA polymerase Y family protein [uncultured Piscinibacter sp.]